MSKEYKTATDRLARIEILIDRHIVTINDATEELETLTSERLSLSKTILTLHLEGDTEEKV